MKNNKYNKVFQVGCGKTGSSSLGLALRILGFNHKSYDRLLSKKYLEGDIDAILKEAEKYEFFTDGPWTAPGLHYFYREPKLYKVFDKEFPNSKFIFPIRETSSWIKSREHWFNNSFLARHRNKMPSELFIVYPNGVFSRDITIRLYRKRNREYVEYFSSRPNDFLIINICGGEGWDKLCPFLGKSIPNVPFPHANKRKIVIPD
ncbi:MAG: hypothetical protein JRI96_14515 [Deltaproteobacteria bacterium]|nr:hypothetical protein [Deltaproteobacteria bacterium]